MSLPPPSKIRSAQRIVSLQNSHYQIQLKSLSIVTSKCGAIDTIAHKICFKHIEGHTVLHHVRTVARVVRFKYPAKPLVQCEMCFSQEISGDGQRRYAPVLLAMAMSQSSAVVRSQFVAVAHITSLVDRRYFPFARSEGLRGTSRITSSGRMDAGPGGAGRIGLVPT
jgi:hypothetical protein